jgi:hypothetical protein
VTGDSGAEVTGDRQQKIPMSAFAQEARISRNLIGGYLAAWNAAAERGLVPHSADLTPDSEPELPAAGLWHEFYPPQPAPMSEEDRQAYEHMAHPESPPEDEEEYLMAHPESRDLPPGWYEGADEDGLTYEQRRLRILQAEAELRDRPADWEDRLNAEIKDEARRETNARRAADGLPPLQDGDPDDPWQH